MNNPFHEGERRVQAHAGVSQMAERIGASIKNAIPLVAAHWLNSQVLAAVSSRGESSEIWASLLTGAPGFLSARDERALDIETNWGADDPLHKALTVGDTALGLLVLEPGTRRRMRLNGLGHLTAQGLQVTANEVYSNCPKYIQTRTLSEPQSATAPHTTTGKQLSATQREWIARADTFFMATSHPQSGADCSHRGGSPGFVRVVVEDSTAHLQWEDYAGNAMFNTLGNLEINPNCGLLFLDWESGAALQLCGAARTRWQGAARRVEFEVDRWRETQSATPLRWRFGEFSPSNP